MSSGSQTTTTNNAPYDKAQPLINQGLRDAKALYDAGGFNIQPYQGSLVAGYDPFRQMADSAAPGVAGAAMQRANMAAGGMQRAMDPNYYNAALQGVKDNVIADVMPAINSTFAMNGRTGGGLHQQNLAKGLSAGVADAYYGAQQSSEDRALNAAGMLPGVANAQYGAFDFLQGAGQGKQDYEQALINADVLQDQQSKTTGLNAIQDYLALSTGAGSQFGVQSSTSSGGGGGLLGALGFGLQAAPLMGSFSDRRLKEDIRRVGETDDGLAIYTYRYKGGDTYHMGVMAQDVEKVKPDAVSEFHGYKAVDYGRLH